MRYFHHEAHEGHRVKAFRIHFVLLAYFVVSNLIWVWELSDA